VAVVSKARFVANLSKKIKDVKFEVGVFNEDDARNVAGKGFKNFAKGITARKTSSKVASVGNAEVLANQKVDVLTESFKSAKPRVISQVADLMLKSKFENKQENLKRATNAVASVPRTFLTGGGISKSGKKVGGIDTGQMYKSIKAKKK
jgi:hypothetical protein